MGKRFLLQDKRHAMDKRVNTTLLDIKMDLAIPAQPYYPNSLERSAPFGRRHEGLPQQDNPFTSLAGLESGQEEGKQ